MKAKQTRGRPEITNEAERVISFSVSCKKKNKPKAKKLCDKVIKDNAL